MADSALRQGPMFGSGAPAGEDLRHHGDAELGLGLVDLAVNVRLGGPPEPVRRAIAAAMNDLGAYPDQTAARQAVAARHGREADEVLLTAGAAEAFVLLARQLRPRQAVVVHPQFTEPEASLRAAGHRVDRVVLGRPFRLDPTLVPDSADLVLVGNPTNPTSIQHPAAILRALVRPGRLVVVDEAFAECVPGEPQSLASTADGGVVVVRSLTKAWSLAGLRCGYLLATPSLVRLLAAAQPRWPVSTPALAACVVCSGPDATAEVREWALGLAQHRAALVAALAAVPGVDVMPDPAASFVLVHHGGGDIVRRRLRTAGFAARRGDTFPGLGADWLRVAVRDTATSVAFAAALAAELENHP